MSEHIKHLPNIPAGENEELYDIEGNLDIETSFSTSHPVPRPDMMLVKTIKLDEFDDLPGDVISIVSDIKDNDSPMKDTVITSALEFVFIPVKASPSVISENTNTYVPGKTPVPIIGPKYQARTNKYYSSQTP